MRVCMCVVSSGWSNKIESEINLGTFRNDDDDDDDDNTNNNNVYLINKGLTNNM